MRNSAVERVGREFVESTRVGGKKAKYRNIKNHEYLYMMVDKVDRIPCRRNTITVPYVCRTAELYAGSQHSQYIPTHAWFCVVLFDMRSWWCWWWCTLESNGNIIILEVRRWGRGVE